jgi:hypothetical protein
LDEDNRAERRPAPANQNDPAAAEKPSLELLVELHDKYLRAVAEREH